MSAGHRGGEGAVALAVLLVGGAVHPSQALRRRLQAADLVVAADGGLRHAEPLGLMPQLLVGDMDSVDAATLASFPDLPREPHPAEKDELDLELGLAVCRRRGAERVLVVGGLSGRLDQTLATCLIVQAFHQGGDEEGVDCEVDDGLRRLWPLRRGEVRRLPLQPGRGFSLLALDAQAVVSLSGARYPLERSTLARGSGRGVSNVAMGEVRIELHEGAMVAVTDR